MTGTFARALAAMEGTAQAGTPTVQNTGFAGEPKQEDSALTYAIAQKYNIGSVQQFNEKS